MTSSDREAPGHVIRRGHPGRPPQVRRVHRPRRPRRALGADLALWKNIPIVPLLVLFIPGTGGAWEEPGSRGFALGRLENRYGALAGPLVLGGFWVFWHAPLFLTGDILWPDVMVIVLIAMLFHATNNAVGGSYASQLFHGHTLTTLAAITEAGWWLIAGGILIRSRHADHRARTALAVGGLS